MKQRLLAPDFIKGISIILMVYGHTTHIGSYSNIQNDIVVFIYTFHMPLFLLISGYFFKISSKPKIQLKAIGNKIGIPYILFISLYLLGLILIKNIGVATNNVPPNGVLQFFKIIFIQPIGSYWFLHSLILINIVFILINYTINKSNIISKFTPYLLLLITFTLLDIMELVEVRTSIYFLLGYIIGELTKHNIKIYKSLIFICLPTCFFLFYQKDVFEFSTVEVTNCLLILSILWIICDIFKNCFLVKVVAWVGQNTLIILLLHALFIVSLKPLSLLLINIDSTGIFYSISVTLITIGLCLLSSKIFDLFGISKYIFKVDKIFKGINK